MKDSVISVNFKSIAIIVKRMVALELHHVVVRNVTKKEKNAGIFLINKFKKKNYITVSRAKKNSMIMIFKFQ